MRKIGLIFVSAALFVGLIWVAWEGLATLEGRALSTTQVLLKASSAQMENALAKQGSDLAGLAATLAADQALANALRFYAGAVNAHVSPNAQPGGAVQLRLKNLRSEIERRIASYRVSHPDLDGVTLMNAEADVMFAESTVFNVSPVPSVEDAVVSAPTRVSAPAPAAGQGDEPNSLPVEPVLDEAALARFPSAVQAAFRGQIRTGALLSSTPAGPLAVQFVGAAPLEFKGHLVGVVVVERRLRVLPNIEGVGAILAADGKIISGHLPNNHEHDGASIFSKPAATVGGEPFRWGKSRIGNPSFGAITIPFRARGVDPSHIGFWAQKFAVPGLETAWGLVYVPMGPFYTELATQQLLIAGLICLAWLFHGVLLALGGYGLQRGLRRLQDVVEQTQSGFSIETSISELHLPNPVRDLAKLIEPWLRIGPRETKPAFDGPPNAAIAPRRPIQAIDPVNLPSLPALATPPPPDADANFELLTSSRGTSTQVSKLPEAFVAQVAEVPAGEELGRRDGTEHTRIGPLPKLDSIPVIPIAENPQKSVPQEKSSFETVFADFMAVRAQCGETNDMSLEKFVARLEQTRAGVISRHQCSDVIFQVYVKNGKAALKAVPVR